MTFGEMKMKIIQKVIIDPKKGLCYLDSRSQKTPKGYGVLSKNLLNRKEIFKSVKQIMLKNIMNNAQKAPLQ